MGQVWIKPRGLAGFGFAGINYGVGAMEAKINKHLGIIQLVGGIIATAVTLTAFAYSNFATKEELHSQTQGIKAHETRETDRIEGRLNRIEEKIDKINERFLNKGGL